MHRLPPLAAVRVFEAAARHMNFSRAADELGMTQAAVSYQVKLLEERLGGALFARTGRRVALTEAGEGLAPEVTAAFQRMDAAFQRLARDEAGVLSISAAPGIAANWLGPRLAGFQLARPDLAIRLTASGELADFARDRLDVAVRMGAGAWLGLRAHLLFPARFQPFCAPELLARHGPFARAEDLLRAPRLNSDDSWWQAWFDAAGVVVDPGHAGGSIFLDSQAIEGRAAAAGQGIAMLTPDFWALEIAAGRLVPAFDLVASDRAFWLVYPEHKGATPKVRAFRDWLLAESAGLRDA